MSKLTPFSFGSSGFNTSEVFYARVGPDFYKSEHLMQTLYYLLWLPGYFGFNWNALYDCLTDFSWINERRIVLEHVELPKLPESELKTYLQLLRDAVLDWNSEDEHCFEVIFDYRDRERVVELLAF